MRLLLQHRQIRSTDELDSRVEQHFLALERFVPIESAEVLLARDRKADRQFMISAQVTVPGSELKAEASAETFQNALSRVVADLENQIRERAGRQRQRLDSPQRSENSRSLSTIH